MIAAKIKNIKFLWAIGAYASLISGGGRPETCRRILVQTRGEGDRGARIFLSARGPAGRYIIPHSPQALLVSKRMTLFENAYNEIAGLVRKLYGLTAVEIRIVEGEAA